MKNRWDNWQPRGLECKMFHQTIVGKICFLFCILSYAIAATPMFILINFPSWRELLTVHGVNPGTFGFFSFAVGIILATLLFCVAIAFGDRYNKHAEARAR